MTVKDIKHFLVVYDALSGDVDIRRFGTDYDLAQDAYSDAEKAHQDEDRYDIVLLSADSLDTLKRTHSSYFVGKKSDELILG